MRLVCPNCEAKYEVPDDAIPDTGRDVQCANCGHAWFQMRARATTTAPLAAEALAAKPEPLPEPAPEPVPEPAPEALTEPVPVAVSGVSGVADPLPVAEAVVPAGPAATPEAPVEAEADASRDGSVAAVGTDEAQPTPGPDVEPALETAVEEPSVLREDSLAETALMQEPGGDAASLSGSDALPDMAETPIAGDDAAFEPPVDAPADGMASEPPTSDVTPDPGPDATAEASGDTGPETPEAAADPEAVAEAAETGIAAPAAAGAAAYAVDESVLAILREEAEREANARKSDAQVLETQTSLGLGSAIKKKKDALTKAEVKPAARRDLLPDVEEINSTLRPTESEADADGLGAGASFPSAARRGFRSGFLTVMTVAILCATLYILSPRIESAVPALADPLEAYVTLVDGLRLHLDGMMRSATVAINGG